MPPIAWTVAVAFLTVKLSSALAASMITDTILTPGNNFTGASIFDRFVSDVSTNQRIVHHFSEMQRPIKLVFVRYPLFGSVDPNQDFDLLRRLPKKHEEADGQRHFVVRRDGAEGFEIWIPWSEAHLLRRATGRETAVNNESFAPVSLNSDTLLQSCKSYEAALLEDAVETAVKTAPISNAPPEIVWLLINSLQSTRSDFCGGAASKLNTTISDQSNKYTIDIITLLLSSSELQFK